MRSKAPLLNQLSKIIADVMKKHQDDPIIDPAALADEITDEIYKEAPEAIRTFVAHHIRQIVRAELRRTHKEESRHRQLAFPDFPLVQHRYPTANGSGYIKADLMSYADWTTNIKQMRAKGGKLADHANQLEAWGRARFGAVSVVEG